MNHSAPLPALDHEKQARLAAKLGLLWALLLSLVYALGLFDELEERLIDQLQLLPCAAVQSTELVLVEIPHIPSDRPWPWPRLDYALFLRGINPQSPQSVVFEMLLHDRDARFSAFDQTFANQIEKSCPILFAAAGLRSPGDSTVPPNLVPFPTTGDLTGLPQFGSSFWPVETFAHLGQVGFSNLATEKNQNLRTVALLFHYRDQIVPSLALWAAALRLQADMSKTTFTLGHELVLRDATSRVLRRVPIDAEGRLRLRFRPNATTMPKMPFDNLILAADQAERGAQTEVDLTLLRQRQVWVAATDRGVIPLVQTVKGALPPVAVHQQATDQILREDYQRSIPTALSILLFVVTGILLSRAFISVGLKRTIPGLLVLMGLILLLALAAFYWVGLSFPFVTFTLHMLGIIFCGIAAHFWEMRPTEDQRQIDLDLGNT